MIIVSIYDGGYGFSVMVNDKIHEDHFLEEDNSKLYKTFRRAYHRKSLKLFIKWIKRKYPKQDIIVCEDGGITVYTTRQRR